MHRERHLLQLEVPELCSNAGVFDTVENLGLPPYRLTIVARNDEVVVEELVRKEVHSICMRHRLVR